MSYICLISIVCLLWSSLNKTIMSIMWQISKTFWFTNEVPADKLMGWRFSPNTVTVRVVGAREIIGWRGFWLHQWNNTSIYALLGCSGNSTWKDLVGRSRSFEKICFIFILSISHTPVCHRMSSWASVCLSFIIPCVVKYEKQCSQLTII